MLTAAGRRRCRRPSRAPRRCPPPGGSRPRAVRGWRSACPARGRGASPSTTGPASRYGAPSSSAAPATSPSASRLLIRLDETSRRRAATSSTTSVSNSGRARSRSASPARAVAEAEVRAHAHATARPARATSTSSQKSSADLPRELGGERDRHQLVHAEPGHELDLRGRWWSAAAAGRSGRRTRSGCGSNVTTVAPMPVLAGAIDALRDHLPVPAVHPVEGAERERRPSRPADLRERPETSIAQRLDGSG